MSLRLAPEQVRVIQLLSAGREGGEGAGVQLDHDLLVRATVGEDSRVDLRLEGGRRHRRVTGHLAVVTPSIVRLFASRSQLHVQALVPMA